MTSILSSYKLYGYDNLFLEFDNLLNNNLLPNKILLSGANGIGKYTFAVHFINYALSKNEEDSYSFESKQININNKSFIYGLYSLKLKKKGYRFRTQQNLASFVNNTAFF